MPKGCPFAPRCDHAMKICLSERPEEMRMNDEQISRCWMNIKDGVEAGNITLERSADHA